MPQQTTADDVHRMLEQTVRAARSAGIDGTQRWYLRTGSRINGRPWRLHARPGASVAVPGLSDGYLGWTKAEALHTLRALAIAWEAVTDARRNASYRTGDANEYGRGFGHA